MPESSPACQGPRGPAHAAICSLVAPFHAVVSPLSGAPRGNSVADSNVRASDWELPRRPPRASLRPAPAACAGCWDGARTPRRRRAGAPSHRPRRRPCLPASFFSVTRDIGRLQRRRQCFRTLDQETGAPGRSHDRRATSNPVVAGGRRLGPPSPCRCAPDGRAPDREDSRAVCHWRAWRGQDGRHRVRPWPRRTRCSGSGGAASHWRARSPSCRCYHSPPRASPGGNCRP